MDNISRRQLIKHVGALLAASVLPGCSCLSGRASNSNNYIFNPDTFRVIDMHAHFFNATDLLAVEYLTGPALNDFVGDKFPATRKLLTIIANAIVSLITKKEISAKQELEWLTQKRPQDILKSIRGASERTIYAEYEQVSKDFFTFISEEDTAKKRKTGDRFEDILRAAVAEWSVKTGNGQKQSATARLVTFDEYSVYRAVTTGASMQKALAEGVDVSDVCPSDPWVIRRILGFLGRALARRSTNVMAYYDRYTLGASAKQPAVRHVLNIGCDFDYFLSCRVPDSPIQDQIRVNEAIYYHTQGFAIPVLGVNPWKFVSDMNYAELVDSTLARGIYKGVKLYPSIGYSVTGNVREGLKACKGVTATRENIRNAMNTLFDICEDRKAFVTSHTTHSKGATRASIALAGSRYWSQVLGQRNSLRVNFGHMGDPDDSNNTDWRKGFMDLMGRYDNVYADFGYHTHYASFDRLSADLTSFRREYGDGIFHKITYGSDWYMISKDEGANAYLCDTTRSFDLAVKKGIISGVEFEAIFHDNAYGFLGLSGSP